VSSTLSYVFCLVRSNGQPPVRRIRQGMPGGADLRAVEVGDDLWAIVQSVPEAEYGETALGRGLQNLDWVGPRAVAHEQVIESFLSARALLPMQLFTLFTSDHRVTQHVRSDRARIARILKRVEHKVEWGLRLTYANPQGPRRVTTPRGVTSAASHAARSAAIRRQSGAGGSGPRSGAEYLARKRDMLDVNRMRLKEAQVAANRVYESVSRLATVSRRRRSLERAAPGSRLLLDAAFLVPSAKRVAFRSAVRQQTRDLRAAGIAVSLTGPWPPYNFIQ
jgi:gas vesicle protein GvpL/GvpF